jgi:hypothetical protein
MRWRESSHANIQRLPKKIDPYQMNDLVSAPAENRNISHGNEGSGRGDLQS